VAFDQGYADALAEAATLRQELAVSEAACATAMAEVEALTADVDRLRTAVRSVLAMVDHGTALPALMHAVVQLRRFVEPEVTP
jgi:hypothetical protein